MRFHRSCGLLLLALSSCGRSGSSVGSRSNAELDPDTAASVGGERVATKTVARIAVAQNTTPAQALQSAIEDALLAEHARKSLPPDMPVVHLERLAASRVLLEQIDHQSREQGPPTDEEVDFATQRRWWELDRPELFRTTHAVVIVNGGKPDSAAEALAGQLREAVSGVTTDKEFQEKARAVAGGKYKIQVEALPPVAADGRAVDPAQPPRPGSRTETFDPAFAQAAVQLSHVGEISPVVHSAFGYHVILLTGRIEAKQLSFEERRRVLAEEIYQRRAQEELHKLLEGLRAATPVVINDSASALTALVRVEQ